MMRKRVLHNDTLPVMTDTQKMNVYDVYFCLLCNGCLQKADTYLDKENIRKCRIHGYEVKDVTHSPLGRAFREMVHPYPRE